MSLDAEKAAWGRPKIAEDRVALVDFPTLNAAKHLDTLLPGPAGCSPSSRARSWPIDPSSTDDTVARFPQAAGAEVVVIPKSKFDHDGARQRARSTACRRGSRWSSS